MTFQAPVTVQEMLAGINLKQYVLPAIQREFVWNTDQIRRLVDSLMRGYPIGSFLVWEVQPATAKDYSFYDFLTNYHERDNPFAVRATMPTGQGVAAILDGQQRLTALNIAVYGSHAEKKKYAWWNSSDAFPRKRLYLNLLSESDEDELGLRYDLRFLTDNEVIGHASQRGWFPIKEVFDLEDSGPALIEKLATRSIDLNDTGAYKRLYALYEALRVFKPINYYLEKSQDTNKVLDIFVRVNSGGTTLSYSDLLLSMATNQWETRDAREEVRSLVSELNNSGSRSFTFSKDLVLKTALMICGIDLRFEVSNFTKTNMLLVEANWDRIRQSLIRAANLLSSFGYNARTLTADSVLVPLAYYAAKLDLPDSYIESSADATDRLVVQQWVTRSLMKRGVWGSGLDTLLGRLRTAIDSAPTRGFPLDQIETAMAAVGKSLTFEPTEVDELLELKYGGQRTFAVLSTLYPGLDYSKQFHEDHVFPKSRFTPRKLRDAGVREEDIDQFCAYFDLLPNLQLLGGTQNVEKLAALPWEWLVRGFGSDAKRQQYIDDNDLDGLPEEISDFLSFYELRKDRMRSRLLRALGVDRATPKKTNGVL